MSKTFARIIVVAGIAVCASGLAAGAQSDSSKPSCAAGDAVVWENTNTKVYHLAGDSFYGKTKHGAYACKSAADSAGYHLAGSKHSSMTASPAPMASDSPAPNHKKHHHHAGAMASPTPAATATPS